MIADMKFFLVVSLLLLAYSFELKSRSNHELTRQIEMKGKGNRVPIDQRGEYIKRQRIMDAQAQIEKNRPKGVPMFKIYVRPAAGGKWIPCGDLAGDQKATALVNAWLSGFLTDFYRGQLDQGIARSVFSQENVFVKGVVENFKPFKKFTRKDLEFGYKVEFPGVVEKMGELPVTPLVKGMEKSWLDNVKDGVSNIFNANKTG